ncbi:Response regulators consisting of a CheY-like receiver domain and a winged-helix DNA-binding domain [Alteromonadaceae bacterium Bs31]|nr:Response regulators consisting of a CheY-like receiver domain and a winged-helix DNA-binding domain [Alteromonadaceae bacterium Bs31]
MATGNRVLIVDDDKFMQSVLRKSLADSYDIEIAGDGNAAIERADAWQPDVILLDVEMPGRNGYEVCDYLKGQQHTAHIPIIFLSSHSSVRERMLGYEVGGDDYLVKPCEKELLVAKLNRFRDYKVEKEQLKSSFESAQKTAIEAITTSADLGKAVRFIERSYLIPNMEKLGAELMGMMRDMQLSASAMFAGRSGIHFTSSHRQQVAPLEQELLQLLHNDKRFIDFGCRTQVNYPRVALLIKNMPLEDRTRYGRLKDILPFVLGATDAKVRVVDAEAIFKRQNNELANAVDSVRQSLEGISKMLENNQQQVGDIMLALNSNLSEELGRLGLEEDQENYILDQFDDASQGINQSIKQGSTILQSMESLVYQLEHLTQHQHQIIEDTLSIPTDDTPDEAGDIELF